MHFYHGHAGYTKAKIGLCEDREELYRHTNNQRFPTDEKNRERSGRNSTEATFSE